MNLIKTLTFSLLFLGLISLFSSCETESTESLVRVRVMSSDSIPVQNAWVHVFSPGGSTVFTDPATSGQYWRKTGLDGWVDTLIGFDYGEAYLDVEASKGGWKGCNFVHAKQGQTSEIIVIIKPFGDVNNGCPQ